MNRDKQREIASKGGRAAHQKGTAHEFSSDEAREAGRKGGQAVSRNREHMAAIGRKGGMESGQRARTKGTGPDQQGDGMPAPAQQDQQSGGQGGGNNPM
jgi:general stress protein YciG